MGSVIKYVQHLRHFSPRRFVYRFIELTVNLAPPQKIRPKYHEYRVWGARSAGPCAKLTSIHWSRPSLDEAAINVIALTWSHWEGRNNAVSMKTPHGNSGVRTRDACMTGETVRRSSHCATSSSLQIRILPSNFNFNWMTAVIGWSHHLTSWVTLSLVGDRIS